MLRNNNNKKQKKKITYPMRYPKKKKKLSMREFSILMLEDGKCIKNIILNNIR
jgi:hypothetical protein